ncbi:tRNA (guanine-N(7)-)-methyltransferase-like [Curcuma longa]|uniref:tRNA (guanine-N(7)-)-methyltransferase-like n=1 Tax=Curcuma longa TaxID=136217 RepID=UPI003D9E8475
MASNANATHVKSQSSRLARKRFYRARAHNNPLSDSHFPKPISPAEFDYSHHYPHFFPPSREHHKNDGEPSPKVKFADIGCGFGGLLVGLSPLFPDTLMLGMELRDKVTEYVKEWILALRASNPGQYENISVVRSNSMKYLPNYFEKAQLSKMYAYALELGGIIYTVTDVEELGDWMSSCLEDHPLFEPVPDQTKFAQLRQMFTIEEQNYTEPCTKSCQMPNPSLVSPLVHRHLLGRQSQHRSGRQGDKQQQSLGSACHSMPCPSCASLCLDHTAPLYLTPQCLSSLASAIIASSIIMTAKLALFVSASLLILTSQASSDLEGAPAAAPPAAHIVKDVGGSKRRRETHLLYA